MKLLSRAKDIYIIRKIRKYFTTFIVDKSSSENGYKTRPCEESQKKIGRKFFLRMGLAAIFIILGFLSVFPYELRFVFHILSVLISGFDIILKAITNLIKKHIFDESHLILIAAVGAFAIRQPYEAAVAVVLFQVGVKMRQYALENSKTSIEKFLDVRPETTKAIIGEETFLVPSQHIKAGDTIILSPGERIAVDGIVVTGESDINISALSGETATRYVAPGSEILSGSLILTGSLTVKATTEMNHSIISRILDLVSRAENDQSKLEQFITKFSRKFSLAVIGVAIIVGFLIPLFGGLYFPDWIQKALVLLIISSPCGLVASIPLAYYCGIGGASRKGILFRSFNTIDTLAHTTSVVFDKTGTLSTGKFQIISLEPVDMSDDELLLLATYAATFSSLPLAKSFVKISTIDVDESLVTRSHEESGKGVIIQLGGKKIISAGTIELMNSLGIDLRKGTDEETTIHVAIERRYAGSILLGDSLREDAIKAVRYLNKLGIDRVAIFTGDSKVAADKTAADLGILEVYADCHQSEKEAKLRNLIEMQFPKDKLVFVGNAMVDAAALHIADVGIAMSDLRADTSVDVSDVVILNDQPSKVGTAIELAKNTNQIVIQNIVLVLALKFIVLILGIFGFATIWMAVFIDVSVSIFAVINALRAFQRKMPLTIIKRILKLPDKSAT